jgi:hypothetical protein
MRPFSHGAQGARVLSFCQDVSGKERKTVPPTRHILQDFSARILILPLQA